MKRPSARKGRGLVKEIQQGMVKYPATAWSHSTSFRGGRRVEVPRTRTERIPRLYVGANCALSRQVRSQKDNYPAPSVFSIGVICVGHFGVL